MPHWKGKTCNLHQAVKIKDGTYRCGSCYKDVTLQIIKDRMNKKRNWYVASVSDEEINQLVINHNKICQTNNTKSS